MQMEHQRGPRSADVLERRRRRDESSRYLDDIIHQLIKHAILNLLAGFLSD
jgi:hypothetical protein